MLASFAWSSSLSWHLRQLILLLAAHSSLAQTISSARDGGPTRRLERVTASTRQKRHRGLADHSAASAQEKPTWKGVARHRRQKDAQHDDDDEDDAKPPDAARHRTRWRTK